MGLMLVNELNKIDIYFISYTAVSGKEDKLMMSIGFEENKGHIEYIIDSRPPEQ